MRRGVRLGVDVGSVRVGVATSDPDGLLATPVETVARSADRDSDGNSDGDGDDRPDLERLTELVRSREVLEVVVGLPRSLSGREGPAAQAARSYARALAARVAPVPVRLVDERLSTVSAHQALRGSGVRERQGRRVVDQVAAVLILQLALDIERSSGRPPGELSR